MTPAAASRRPSSPPSPRKAAAALALAVAATAAGGPARAFTATPPAAAAAEAAGPVSTAATGARCIGPAFDDTAAFQAAIDTGHTVYAPALGGRCHITHALVMRTPGQIFHGDGRARTKIVIEPGFTGEGVFVAKTGEPGPVWRDFSVSFVQPDTDDRAKLTRYPPAFSAVNTPRFEMDHLGCYVATMCVDMRGNSGGATIADLQFDAFEVGIDIDGSFDTVRLLGPHWWPFLMSSKLQSVFYGQGPLRGIAVRIGRVDGFLMSGGLFYGGGLALLARVTALGSMTGGLIDTTNFDSGSGIKVNGASLVITGSSFFVALAGARGLDLDHGTIIVNGCDFAGRQDPLIELRSGSLLIGGSRFKTDEADVTAILTSAPDSFLELNNTMFVREERRQFRNPTIVLNGGSGNVFGNYASKTNDPTNIFLKSIAGNSSLNLNANVMSGWSILRR